MLFFSTLQGTLTSIIKDPVNASRQKAKQTMRPLDPELHRRRGWDGRTFGRVRIDLSSVKARKDSTAMTSLPFIKNICAHRQTDLID